MRSLVAASLLLLAGAVGAQPLPERLASLDALSAQVVQKTFDFDGTLLQESQAKLALKKPGNLRWETGEPDDMAVICDGTTLWVHQKLLEQVTLYDAAKLIVQSPFALLLGDGDTWKDYQITEKGNSYVLVPKESSEYAEITLDFAGDDLDKLTVVDSQGQKLEFDFVSSSRGEAAVRGVAFNMVPSAELAVDDQRGK